MVIWGNKTEAFLDVWSIEHVLMGIGLGALWVSLCQLKILKLDVENRTHQIIVILLISFMWETLEHYLETGLAGKLVEDWLYGVEHWSNRLISDHIAVLIGVSLYNRFNVLSYPARAMSFIWLFVHIFVFPHSMYLHHIF